MRRGSPRLFIGGDNVAKKNPIVEMDINEIIINKGIYPREDINKEKIKEYAELIENGYKFPPLVVNAKTKHLIDGYHRLQAYEKIGAVKVWVELIDIPEEEEWIEAVKRNRHGLPLSMKERREFFREHYKQYKPKINRSLAEAFGVSVQTLYNWIQDLLEEKQTRKLTEGDKQRIVEMYESGNYTREEIAEKFNISPDRVNQIVKQSEEFKILNSSPNVTSSLTAPASESSREDETIPDEEIEEALAEHEKESEEKKKTEIIETPLSALDKARNTAKQMEEILMSLLEISEDNIAIFLEHYQEALNTTDLFFFIQELDAAIERLQKIRSAIPLQVKEGGDLSD